MYTKLAAATDDASSAVVQNNSWGYPSDTLSWARVDTFKAEADAAGKNYYAYWAEKTGVSEADFRSYVNALDNFQSHGVIVRSAGNASTTSGRLDGSITGGMAVLFPELQDAYIAAVELDVTGTEGSRTYTHYGNPCGQGAAFCLGTNSFFITAPSYIRDDGISMSSRTQGTSFSAPQVSGAIALLAEHFPNQSPEQ